MSHANSLLHEFLAKRSSDCRFDLDTFCRDRYGAVAGKMADLWKRLRNEQAENSFRVAQMLFCNHFNLLFQLATVHPAFSECRMRENYRAKIRNLPPLAGIYADCAAVAEKTSDPMVLRDLADLARTHLMSDILRKFCVLMEALWMWRKGDGEKPSSTRLVQQIEAMGNLLFSHDDFSLTKSLERLASVHPLNPDSGLTLKGNAENRYCRSYIAELYPAVYVPEAKFYRDWIRKAERNDREDKEEFLAAAQKIRDRFYRIPLARFAPKRRPDLVRTLHAQEKLELPEATDSGVI